MKILNNINLRLTLLKCRLFLMKRSLIKKFLRNKYCRLGCHKISNGTYEYYINKRKRTIRYIKCSLCNYKFFAKQKDKEDYEEAHNQFNKLMFNALLNKSKLDTSRSRKSVSNE